VFPRARVINVQFSVQVVKGQGHWSSKTCRKWCISCVQTWCA